MAKEINKEKSLKPESEVSDTELMKILLEQNELLRKDVQMLKGITSTQRQKDWTREQAETGTQYVYLKGIKGKVVVAWKTVSDEVFRNTTTGAVTENQRLAVQYLDGSEDEMDILNFHRHSQDRVYCRILKIDYKSNVCTLELPDSHELLEISLTYVNP